MIQIEFWTIAILLSGHAFHAKIECMGPKPLTEKNAACIVSVPAKCVKLRFGSLDCDEYEMPPNCKDFKVLGVEQASSNTKFIPRFGCAHPPKDFSAPPAWVYGGSMNHEDIANIEWSRPETVKK